MEKINEYPIAGSYTERFEWIRDNEAKTDEEKQRWNDAVEFLNTPIDPSAVSWAGPSFDERIKMKQASKVDP